MPTKSPARLARGVFLCPRFALLLVFASLLGGCVTVQPRLNSGPHGALNCDVFYQQFERAVAAAGVSDAGSWRIDGEPRLRTNRLLAQLASGLQSEPLTSAAWQRWLELAAALAKERQQIEWQQLSPVTRQAIAQGESLAVWQQRCSPAPVKASKTALARPIPDEYSSWQRWLGFYPITQLGPKLGLAALRQKYVTDFSQPLAALATTQPLRLYSSRSMGLPKLPHTKPTFLTDPLGLPQAGPQLASLLQQHSPLWEIETAGSNDKPASLNWNEARQTTIANTQQPAEYQFTSYTWLNGAWRLQLNYQLWFPARTAKHPADILAGRLDGIVWRVTLNEQGEPLVYDSIHPCGCYHLIIPSAGFVAREQAQQWPEPPIVLPALQTAAAGGSQLKLRVSSGEHQLRGIAIATRLELAAASKLVHRPYSDLLNLTADNNQTRSAFRTDALVSKTDRAERFLLWPMGIRSAGAMRQAGRQPVAFVGKRHFDDWNLLDRIVELIAASNE